MPKEPAGADQINDIVWNEADSQFVVDVTIKKGPVEASPNADFVLKTTLGGVGISNPKEDPIADLKPVADVPGGTTLRQNVPFGGAAATYNVDVTSVVRKGTDHDVGNAVTFRKTVIVTKPQ